MPDDVKVQVQLIGSLQPYVIGEDFETYLNSFNNYIELNEITEEKKKIRLLLNVIGIEASEKIRKMCYPKTPVDFKSSEIIDKCKAGFCGEKNAFIDHYNFHSRDQKDGEKFFDYSLELQALAEKCEFKDFRNLALRDRFVMGIKSSKIRYELIKLGNKSTFETVVSEARKLETLEKDANRMGKHEEIDYVDRGRSRSRGYSRGRNHFRSREKGNKGRNWYRSRSRNYYENKGSRDRNENRKDYDKKNRSKSRNRDDIQCFACKGWGHFANHCHTRKRENNDNQSKKSVNNRLDVIRKANENEFGRLNDSVLAIQGEKGTEVLNNKNNVEQMETDDALGNTSRSDLNVILAAKLNLKNYNEEELLKTDEEIEEKKNVNLNKPVNKEEIKNWNDHCYSLLGTESNTNERELVEINADNQGLQMEVDTGAVVSVCSEYSYNKYFKRKKLEKVDFPLSGASGLTLDIKGEIKVRVVFRNRSYRLPLIVIKGDRPLMLLGRNWLDVLYPRWRQAFRINEVNNSKIKDFIEDMKVKYKNVFAGDISEPVKDFEVDIQLTKDAVPIVYKPYKVAFSMKDKIEKELDRLVKENILVKVSNSKWASPIVVVPKPDGSIRICGNYAVTVNQFISTDHYPVPEVDDILTEIGEFLYYIVLDLKGAFLQLMLSRFAQELLVITTHLGLFAYLRMPFGIKPASSIFQALIDRALKGIKGVFAYIDDIILGGNSIEELMEKLDQVLERLSQFNIKVNFEKCSWFVTEVLFLGHKISKQGIMPNPEKIKAIVEAPSPKNVTQLKSFVGLVNYYSKFVPEISMLLKPFYNLLRKEVKWLWSDECENAFKRSKQTMIDARILVHYDPKKPMALVCDASDEGISAILCHEINSQERPIYFASRVLTPTEKKYPILHREALAIVFGLEKYYKFIFGYQIKVFTDHKPLLGIFGKRDCLKTGVIASRIQRYLNRIAHFTFEVHYRAGPKNLDADCLSRLPIPVEMSTEDKLEENLSIKVIENEGEITLNLKMIEKETIKDAYLSKLIEYILDGWPSSGVPKIYKDYYGANVSLSIEHGCIFYGNRVVVPNSLKEKALELLHINHIGIVRMKQMARKYCFWIGINKDIESFVRSCNSCQLVQSDKRDKVYSSWPEAKYPFERVHLDFFYFDGKHFLIFIDAYSRWLDVKKMTKTTADSLIDNLEDIWGYFGYPTQLVCDNGPPFGSYEFKRYCELKGITLTHSPPYHPESNGLAERAVQSVKKALRKLVFDSQYSNSHFHLEKSLKAFLRNQRILPTTSDGIIPANKVLSYNPRWEIDAIKVRDPVKVPERTERKKVHWKENKRNSFKEKPERILEFKEGDKVWYIKSLDGKLIRYVAVIEKKLTKYLYRIRFNERYITAHLNQLQRRIVRRTFVKDMDLREVPTQEDPIQRSRKRIQSQDEVELRRSGRDRREPDRLQYTHPRLNST